MTKQRRKQELGTVRVRMKVSPSAAKKSKVAKAVDWITTRGRDGPNWGRWVLAICVLVGLLLYAAYENRKESEEAPGTRAAVEEALGARQPSEEVLEARAASKVVLGTRTCPDAARNTEQQPAYSTFTVHADKGWQPTGRWFEAGEPMKVLYVSGLWTVSPGDGDPYDAAGDPSRDICSKTRPASRCEEAVPDAPPGALIACVGGSLPIPVGKSATFVAPRDGPLYLAPNVPLLSDLTGNSGRVVVRIVSLSSPAEPPLSPTATPGSAAATPTAETCRESPFVVAAFNANVRSGPGTVYKAVGYLQKEEKAEITSRNPAGTWWRIRLPGDRQYSRGSQYWIADSVVALAGSANCVPVERALPAQPTPAPVVQKAKSEPSRPKSDSSSSEPHSSTPTSRYTVRMYKVDDVATLYINGEPKYKARWGHYGTESNWNYFGHKPGDSGEIDITHHLNQGSNTLRFELWNKRICCYVTLQIEVREDGKVIFSDSYQKSDSSEGIKYDETITIDVK